MDKIIELVKSIEGTYVKEESSFSAYLVERNELADKHLATLKAINTEISNAKSILSKELSNLNSELESAKNEYSLLKSSQAETTLAYENKLKSITLLIEAKEQTSNELDLKIESIQSMYDSSVAKKKEISQHLIELQGAVSAKESELRTLENSITVLSKREVSLTESVGALTNQSDDLNTDIRKKSETISILESRITSLKNK